MNLFANWEYKALVSHLFTALVKVIEGKTFFYPERFADTIEPWQNR